MESYNEFSKDYKVPIKLTGQLKSIPCRLKKTTTIFGHVGNLLCQELRGLSSCGLLRHIKLLWLTNPLVFKTNACFSTPGGSDVHPAVHPQRETEDDAGVVALHEAGEPETAEGLLRNDQGAYGFGDNRKEGLEAQLSFEVKINGCSKNLRLLNKLKC